MITHIFPKNFKPLPIYFITMSSYHEQEPVQRKQGVHDKQILFVLSGEGALTVFDKEYKLSCGTAFYLNRDVPHSYYGDGLISAWITFRGDAITDITRYSGSRDFVFYQGVDVSAYQRAISEMESEYFDKKREGRLSAMLYSAVMSFFTEDSCETVSDMDRALAYMEEHFSEKVTLADLCEVCHMGHSSFSKKFSDYFGVSAFEKLMEIRLINADMMLRHRPTEKVYTIAHECGFSDVGYFCRAYKRKFGKTPRAEQ